MSLLKNKRLYIFEVVAHRAVGIGRKRTIPSPLVPRPGCPTCSSVDSRILSVPVDSRFKREQSECRPQGQSDQHSAESDQLADTFLKASENGECEQVHTWLNFSGYSAFRTGMDHHRYSTSAASDFMQDLGGGFGSPRFRVERTAAPVARPTDDRVSLRSRARGGIFWRAGRPRFDKLSRRLDPPSASSMHAAVHNTLQPATPPHLPIHTADLPGRSYRTVARCRRSGMTRAGSRLSLRAR